MTNDQFWSIFAMPIGLIFCFWPVVLAWMLAGRDKPEDPGSKSKP